MHVCQNTQQTPTHHLTKTLNYLPYMWDLNRNRSAVLEKLHSVNMKAYFTATAEENGLMFQTPAAKTRHKQDMDLTMSGKLQEVKGKKRKHSSNRPPCQYWKSHHSFVWRERKPNK